MVVLLTLWSWTDCCSALAVLLCRCTITESSVCEQLRHEVAVRAGGA